MTVWSELEPPAVLVEDVSRPFSISLSGDLELAFREWLTESFGGRAFLNDEDVARYRDASGSGWSFRCDQLAREREASESKSDLDAFRVFVAPDCPICGEPTNPVYAWAYQEPVRWLCAKLHDDDLLPARALRPTPGDEVIAEWERLGMSAETAERLETFFSRADREPHPPVPVRADSDARAAGGSAGVSLPDSRCTVAGGTRGPGDLAQRVIDAVKYLRWELNRPPTAFEIAGRVALDFRTRWAEVSVRRKVSQLAGRGVLRVVDCDGVSPNGVACYRYEVV